MKNVRKMTSMSQKSSWIKFDRNGVRCSVDMDKYDLMRRVNIDARDFRILDPLLSYPSTILPRQNAIVLNLEHIKAVITAEELFLQESEDENVVPVVEEMQRRLTNIVHTNQGVGQDNITYSQHDSVQEMEPPFEFQALEVILEAICSFLAARTTELEMDTYPALDELTTQISSRNLDRIRRLKNTMTGLIARVQKVKDELEQLMDDDDDMANIYLTRKWLGRLILSQSGASLGEENGVEELEMLLEAYFMQIDDALNRLTKLRVYIDDTEDYINIHMDNHRNQLIQLEIFLYSADISLASYALLCGIFGMSIPYSWNHNHSYIFKWVVIFAGLFSIIIFLFVVAFARKKGLLGS